MSARDDARARLAGELTDERSDDSRRTLDNIWGTYERFCVQFDQPPMPTGTPGEPTAEVVLLRYLHASVRRDRSLAWSSARNIAYAIAVKHMRAGHPDPRGDRVTAWFSAYRREVGSRKKRPTDTMTGAQVTHAVLTPLNSSAAWVPRLRGVAVTALALDLMDKPDAVNRVWALPADAFTVGPSQVAIRTPDGLRGVVDKARQPMMYAALVAALADAGDAEKPLAARPGERPRVKAGVSPFTGATQPNLDTRALRAAWHRSIGLSGTQATHEELRDGLAAADQASIDWWLGCMDRHLLLRRRDTAYFLVGVNGAHRHIELKRLRVGSISEVPTGYYYEIANHKAALLGARHGKTVAPLQVYVDHIDRDGAECTAHCPACALRAHLEARLRLEARPEDPLFITTKGTELTSLDALKRVQRMFNFVGELAAVDDGTEVRIGTRTLRVTAATLARLSGMSYADIATYVTRHSSEDLAQLYVRRIDPWTSDLSLPVNL